MPLPAYLVLPQTRMVALAETIEVFRGRVTFQTAVMHEKGNGDKAWPQTLAQGLGHRLLVVHLTVAYGRVALAESQPVLARLLDEIP